MLQLQFLQSTCCYSCHKSPQAEALKTVHNEIFQDILARLSAETKENYHIWAHEEASIHALNRGYSGGQKQALGYFNPKICIVQKNQIPTDVDVSRLVEKSMPPRLFQPFTKTGRDNLYARKEAQIKSRHLRIEQEKVKKDLAKSVSLIEKEEIDNIALMATIKDRPTVEAELLALISLDTI
jgi:hypothetical protein